MSYDILIIGAGMAGLHCAMRLSQAYPTLTIAIAEAYNYIGGRVVTYTPPGFSGIHWESGAGRIHSSHTMMLSYIRRYGLETFPITSEPVWTPSVPGKSEYSWKTLSSMIYSLVSNLPKKLLASNTLQEILQQIFGKERTEALLYHFPYRAELTTLRADLGIEAFKHEMGSSSFIGVKAGYSAVIDKIVATLKQRNVTFLLNYRLTSLSTVDQNPMCLLFNDKPPLYGKRVILAIHAEALRGVSPFRRLPLLQHLTMRPLLRTYAVFPVKQGKSWFDTTPKIVTDSPLRYIIPINPKKGLIMTSYTDDKDTMRWAAMKDDAAMSKAILDELRQLLPEKKIPAPLYFKSHLWRNGCTYWLPGQYNPKELSDSCMRPLPMRLPQLYLCGESYSMKQAWIEGALEHAEDMLQKYFFRSS
jgi:monoamine oxidase